MLPIQLIEQAPNFVVLLLLFLWWFERKDRKEAYTDFDKERKEFEEKLQREHEYGHKRDEKVLQVVELVTQVRMRLEDTKDQHDVVNEIKTMLMQINGTINEIKSHVQNH
jgi:uncharacterized coiled-coil DUF342 family protein